MEIFYFIAGIIAAFGFMAGLNIIFMRIAKKSMIEGRKQFEDAIIEHQRQIINVWEQIENNLFYMSENQERKKRND